MQRHPPRPLAEFLTALPRCWHAAFGIYLVGIPLGLATLLTMPNGASPGSDSTTGSGGLLGMLRTSPALREGWLSSAAWPSTPGNACPGAGGPVPSHHSTGQVVMLVTAWPVVGSNGTDSWSWVMSQCPSTRRKPRVARTHMSISSPAASVPVTW